MIGTSRKTIVAGTLPFSRPKKVSSSCVAPLMTVPRIIIRAPTDQLLFEISSQSGSKILSSGRRIIGVENCFPVADGSYRFYIENIQTVWPGLVSSIHSVKTRNGKIRIEEEGRIRIYTEKGQVHSKGSDLQSLLHR